MRINLKTKFTEKTHEGAPASRMTAEQQLRRCVLSNLLWEDEFYQDGESIADVLAKAAHEVSPAILASLALEARSRYNLRHVPLLLLSILAETGRGTALVGDAIAATIQRADEMAEFLSVHAKRNGVTPDRIKPKISKQMKLGLAKAFDKFSAYSLAKYDRDGAIKLRDVLFLCHAKPKDAEQAALWQKLIDGTLEAPDTWEVKLSGGADKKETWERLLREEKLGYLAVLRNLRNMTSVGVDAEVIKTAILARKGAERVFPFRYIAAARACPQMEPFLDQALIASLEGSQKLTGKTVVLVDVSGSMISKMSGKSDLMRIDAACALASIINGNLRVFSFSQNLVEVPPRKGMAGVDTIRNSQGHGGTALGAAVDAVNAMCEYDRMVVITDEQSQDRVSDPKGRGYMINVASNKNGVGYGKWTHIDGFSEQVLRFIHELEAS